MLMIVLMLYEFQARRHARQQDRGDDLRARREPATTRATSSPCADSLIVLGFAVPVCTPSTTTCATLLQPVAALARRQVPRRLPRRPECLRDQCRRGEGDIDNPDQRISEDINTFTGRSTHFMLLMLGSAMQLVAFCAVLWSLSKLARRLPRRLCHGGHLPRALRLRLAADPAQLLAAAPRGRLPLRALHAPARERRIHRVLPRRAAGARPHREPLRIRLPELLEADPQAARAQPLPARLQPARRWSCPP